MTAAIAFAALFAAILCALTRLPAALAPVLGAASLLAAAVAGVLTLIGLSMAAIGAGIAYAATRQPSPRWVRALLLGLLGAYALAAALHRLPGFLPLPMIEDFGRGGAFDLAWKYDKGYAGLLLVWAHRRLTPPAAPWAGAGYRLALLAMLAALLVLLAVASGLGRWDPRWLPGLGIWLLGNLFLTVAAEEAFFRGLLQRALERWWAPRRRVGAAAAVAASALLFGLVHLPWGASFAVLATLAGVGYGVLYGRRHALGWAIAGHAGVNAAILTLLHSPMG